MTAKVSETLPINTSMTIHLSYGSKGEYSQSLSVQSTDTVRSVLEKYLKVFSVWRFQK